VRIFALCCAVSFALPAAIQTCAAEELPAARSRLTVLLNYEHPYSSPAFAALERQLQNLLGEAGVQVDVREQKSARAGEEFADVMIFNMKGHCSMASRRAITPLPVGALSDERGPLAMAYTTDGDILPFGEVECDHVRQSLERLLGKSASKQQQDVFGSALGTVMAHEVYHMLSHRAKHTKAGVTKESLSAREMLEGSLTFSDKARAAISLVISPGAR
jgi:hypothetical protein